MSKAQAYIKLRDITNKNCESCPSSCCDVTKYLILIREGETQTFEEIEVQSYSLDQINVDSLFDWYDDKTRYVLDTNGNQIEKPALLQFGNHGYAIYAEKYCPHLTENMKCGIFEQKNRPVACVAYPMATFPKEIFENGISTKRFKVTLDDRCHITTIRSQIQSLTEHGKNNGYEISVENMTQVQSNK